MTYPTHATADAGQTTGLTLALGLIAAAFVAAPAIEANVAKGGTSLVAVLIAAFLLMRLQSLAPGGGVRRSLLLGTAVVLTLVALSVSFGLVASLSPVWVIAPAAVTLVAVTALARSAYS